MSYEDSAPAADKVLHADGSVTTMAGEAILPADPIRAAQYAEMSPQAAKWLLPDGRILSEIPVPPIGTAFTGYAVPEMSAGDAGDIYIASDGIYTRKLVQLGGGFILSGTGTVFDGYWRDMGVNTVTSNSGGDPQGSHYYRHESDAYYLCWNSAYSGYWWINTNLAYDNGSATAYRSTATYTPIPPGDNWSGSLMGSVTWTPTEPGALHLIWERCFEFYGKNNLPYYKTDRLMKYAEGLTKELAPNGNMARIDSDRLFVGEATYVTHSPTAATQALSIGTYRNFKVNLSAAAITLSFSGSVPSGSYPTTIKVWLIPKSTVSGTPKHTVTWPASVKWASTNDHRLIGATGQPDTPMFCELTTFDNGTTWIGRAVNVLNPDKEV